MATGTWHEEIKQELYGSNERTIIIVACAMMQDKLIEILLSHLKESPTKEDNLFGATRPLSSFSATIEMAYRLRVIDANIRKALNLLRKIRNHSAHSSTPFSFSSSPSKDRISEISK